MAASRAARDAARAIDPGSELLRVDNISLSFGGVKALTDVSVSYTHLTLPTICSV